MLKLSSCALALATVLAVPAVAGAQPVQSGPPTKADAPDNPTTDPQIASPLAESPIRAAVKERLSGPDRYGTAIAATKKQFADHSVQTVYIASGENFPDAIVVNSLVAAASTKDAKSAVLLSPAKGLTSRVLDEITRILRPGGQLRLIGGTQALSPEVEQQLARLLPDATIRRIAGATRVETAVEIATELQQVSDIQEVVITPAEEYGISIVAAPLAIKRHAVHLVAPSATGSMHPAVTEWVGKAKPTKVTLVGQPNFLPTFSHPGLTRLDDQNPAPVSQDWCRTARDCIGIPAEHIGPEQIIAEKILVTEFPDSANLLLVSRTSAVDGIAAGQVSIAQQAPILPINVERGTESRYGRLLAEQGKRRQVTFWAIGGERVIPNGSLDRAADAFTATGS